MVFPGGKTFALALSPHVDGSSAWMAGFGKTDQSHLARGEYGVEVGVPRLLDCLDRFGLPATWFVTGHTAVTWPDHVRAIVNAGGHEVAAHGCFHERLSELRPGEEPRLLQRQLEQLDTVLGLRPRGYCAPSGVITDQTLTLLEQYGFDWDSSLSARDYSPYYPRMVTNINVESASAFGPPSTILEFPVSWYTEDWAAFEYVSRISEGMNDTEVVLRRWLDILDYGRLREAPGVMTLSLHPETIARGHHMLMFERFLEEVGNRTDVWVATLSDIYTVWTRSVSTHASS